MNDFTETLDGYGVKIGYSEDDGSTWTALANVTEITPPDEVVEMIENWHLNSPNKTKTYKSNWKEPGESSITLHFREDYFVTLKALAGYELQWKQALPDGTAAGTFPGHVFLRTWTGTVTSVTEGPTNADIKTMTINIKNSGLSTVSQEDGPATLTMTHS